MRFTKYGKRELKLFGALAAALLLLVLTLGVIFFRVDVALLVSLPFVALLALVVMFFRDPVRRIPRGEHRLVAPADGTIYDIGEVELPEYFDEPVLRVGIFLSVFDCHINRVPCSGTVEKVVYREGSFYNAWTQANECSERNESNLVMIADAAGTGVRVGVKQIAGQIARRIVCELKDGDAVERGQPFGMIKFGSRTEFFVPSSASFVLKVKVRDFVRAGSTVLGNLEAGAAPVEESEASGSEEPDVEPSAPPDEPDEPEGPGDGEADAGEGLEESPAAADDGTEARQ